MHFMWLSDSGSKIHIMEGVLECVNCKKSNEKISSLSEETYEDIYIQKCELILTLQKLHNLKYRHNFTLRSLLIRDISKKRVHY